jgi:NADH-ubiquinone oxidoreductase chain 5
LPTPVSALIHAATMVTAGVYLLIRTSPLIEYSDTVLLICLWLGALTTMSSSLIGFFQQDIKKIIAYSTMSQLGMMVIAIGLSCYNTALFHLINHAFYKALLFLGAGSVIHAIADNQDLRKYGGLKLYLPLTYTVIFIASMSLIAFPFMSGFYSKDFILESSYGQFLFSSSIVYFLAIIGATFTTLYSVKIIYLAFLAKPNGSYIDYTKVHESDLYMSIPLVLLGILSIVFGFITKDIFIGLGSGFFLDNAIFIHPTHEILTTTEYAVPTLFKILPFIFSIMSIIFYFLIMNKFSLINLILYLNIKLKVNFIRYIFIIIKSLELIYTFVYSTIYYIYNFFSQRLFFELFYNKYVSQLALNLGGQTTKFIDKGSIEYIGPYGLEVGLSYLSKKLSNLDSGLVTSYALYILSGFILYIYFWNYNIYNEILLIIFISLGFIFFKKN